MNQYLKFIDAIIGKQFEMLGGAISMDELKNAIITKKCSSLLLQKFDKRALKVYERWLLAKYNNIDQIIIDNKFISEMVDLKYDLKKIKKILKMIKRITISNISIEPEETNEYIILSKIRIYKSDRIKFLINKYGFDNTLNSCLRYISVTPSSGQQLAIPQSHYDLLYDQYGVRYEGFASPFNSGLIEKKNGGYCSLFYDVDKQLGSLGSFFNVKLNKYDGHWVVNPPFIESLIDLMADHIINNMPKAIYVIVADWKDANGIRKMINIAKSYKVIDRPIFENVSEFSKKMEIIHGNFKVLYLAIGQDANTSVFNQYPQFH